jgi:hypothetical protein
MISGETNGKVGVSYVYSAVTTDSEGDQVYYWFDWGDGTNYGWIGPYDSGTTVNGSHVWSSQGTYIIKVKAKDIHDEESDWGTLEVTMPKNQITNSCSMLRTDPKATPKRNPNTQASAKDIKINLNNHSPFLL